MSRRRRARRLHSGGERIANLTSCKLERKVVLVAVMMCGCACVCARAIDYRLGSNAIDSPILLDAQDASSSTRRIASRHAAPALLQPPYPPPFVSHSPAYMGGLGEAGGGALGSVGTGR